MLCTREPLVRVTAIHNVCNANADQRQNASVIVSHTRIQIWHIRQTVGCCGHYLSVFFSVEAVEEECTEPKWRKDKEQSRENKCSLVDFSYDALQHQVGREIDCCQEPTDYWRWDWKTDGTHTHTHTYKITHTHSTRANTLLHLSSFLLIALLPLQGLLLSKHLAFKSSMHNQYYFHTQGRGNIICCSGDQCRSPV